MKIFGFLKKFFGKKFIVRKVIQDEIIISPIDNIDSNVIQDIILEEQNNKPREFEEEFLYGTIIWAKRYSNEKEMNHIPEGHRDGPYIVVDQTDKGLVCLYCSSTPPKYEDMLYRTLIINDFEFGLKKVTYVYCACNELITKNRYIKTNGFLSVNEQKDLAKKIEIVNDEGMYVGHDFSHLKTPIEMGDIVKKGKLTYLVVSVEDDNLKCVEIRDKYSPNDRQDDKYTISGITYKVLMKSFCYIRANEVKRIDTVCNITFNAILKKIKEYYDNLNSRFDVKRGALIKKDNNLYYIYGEMGNNWLAFLVTDKEQSKMARIMINCRTFYTDFNTNTTLDKKEKPYIHSFATDNEMDNIKEIKKDYLKEQVKSVPVKKKIKNEKPKIRVGSIVKEKTLNDTLYLVINRGEYMLVTVPLEEAKNGIYNFERFDVEFVRNMDKLSIDNNTLHEILTDIKRLYSDMVKDNDIKKLRK